MKNLLACFLIFNCFISSSQNIKKTLIGKELFFNIPVVGNTLILSNECSEGIMNSLNKTHILYIDLYIKKIDPKTKKIDTSFSCISLVDTLLIKKLLNEIETKEKVNNKTILIFSYLNSSKEYIFLINIFNKKRFNKFIKKPFSKKTKYVRSARENIQLLEINDNKFSKQYIVLGSRDSYKIFNPPNGAECALLWLVLMVTINEVHPITHSPRLGFQPADAV